MAKVQGVAKVLSNIRKQTEKIKKDVAGNVSELSNGVWLALSNAAKKATMKRPTKGGKFSGNANYKPSSTPYKAFVPQAGGGTDDSLTVEQVYNVLKKERIQVDKPKRRRKRKLPPRKYRFVDRIPSLHVHGEKNPQFSEIFRVGGNPNPKSWGTGGKFYLRQNWRTQSVGFGQNVVSISPEAKTYNNNQKLLRQLEDGGTMMGGPKAEGYEVYFKTVGRFVHVSFRKRTALKKPIRVQPRHFVKNTMDRIKKKLASQNLSSLKKSDWRRLGSN